MWRIGANDIEDFVAEAYRRTAERVAAINLVRPLTLITSDCRAPSKWGAAVALFVQNLSGRAC